MTNAMTTAERSFWVVVADESKAIFYTRKTRRGPMQEQFSLENEAARAKTGELLSDRGGRSFDSAGKGRHTMAKEKSGPKRHLAETFAKQIAERIAKASHVGNCIGYSLIAPPRFLGLLRDALGTTAAQEPLQTVSKEVVGKDTTFLQNLLDQ
jgi:protein required for attachment to host cells